MFSLLAEFFDFLADVHFVLPLWRPDMHRSNSAHLLDSEVSDSLQVPIAPDRAEVGRLILARVLAVNILAVVDRIQKVNGPHIYLGWGWILYAFSLAHLCLDRVEETSMAHCGRPCSRFVRRCNIFRLGFVLELTNY